MNFWDLGKAKEQDLSKFNETTKEVIIIDLTLHSTNLYRDKKTGEKLSSIFEVCVGRLWVMRKKNNEKS